MSDPAYLSALNPEQRRAVEHFGAPLLILAGAGSGKTRVITTKIALLVERGLADARSILAVTFTNKAANEMKGRVLALAPHAGAVMVRTFHSFGAWLLRVNAAAAGLEPGFLIYDEDDSLGLLRVELGGEPDRGTLRRLLEGISRAKDLGLSPSDAPEDLAAAGCDPAAYAAYERRLRATGNVDFGDLILMPLRLLRERLEVKARTQDRFRVVFVDEYQDSNVAQFRLLHELHRSDGYLCVVGDDDQSIYRFRGAEVGNILSFPDAFPGTEIVRLERNYRSTQAILDVAAAVVSRNTGRLGKTLWTEAAGGEPVSLSRLVDQDDEAAWCARLVTRGGAMDTAILYRTNAQSRPFEELFFRLGIPYRVVGTVRFYAREEVKDAIAWLALLANGRDEVAFRRVVNRPPRGVGRSSVERIVDSWREGGGTLWDACRRVGPRLTSKARAGLADFVAARDDMAGLLDSLPLGALLQAGLERTGLKALYAERDRADGTSKAGNLEELVNATAGYAPGVEGLTRFLEHCALNAAPEEADDGGAGAGRVTLITLHNTKGLEFDRVVVTGLEEGIFPYESGLHDPDEVEEERRLFYVGVTRARERLHLTWCARRQLFGRWQEREPSRFLAEIPARLLALEETEEAADGGWPLGAGVFHEEYGTGTITGRSASGGNLVLQVRFRSGRTARFLPKYARLERVSEE
ncbi:MAG: UvrD-helicase domain-containing protein [Spirochaetes bacterium]|nr:UvrD-helicase domain-containing protein [Spirochaetota bacterium]